MAKVKIKNSPSIRKSSKRKRAKKNDRDAKRNDAKRTATEVEKPTAKQTWFESLEPWERAELFSAATSFTVCLFVCILWYAFGPGPRASK